MNLFRRLFENKKRKLERLGITVSYQANETCYCCFRTCKKVYKNNLDGMSYCCLSHALIEKERTIGRKEERRKKEEFENEKIFKSQSLNNILEKTKKQIKPKTKCGYCGKSNLKWIYTFYCKYCSKYYCIKHRLPESHKCTGKPKSPYAPIKVSISKGSYVVSGK